MDTSIFILEFETQVDEEGIGDCLSVAVMLVREAHRMVTFYTKGCPGCTGAALASMLRYAMEVQPREDGLYSETRFIATTATVHDDATRYDAFDRHRARFQALLDDLLHSGSVHGTAPHVH